jgi:hypothetical protein
MRLSHTDLNLVLPTILLIVIHLENIMQNGCCSLPPVSPMLDESRSGNFSGMDRCKADEPGIVFKLFLLSSEGRLCLFSNDLGSPGFAANIKTWNHGSARSTPFIDNAPKSFADNVNRLLIQFKAAFGGSVYSLPPLC